MKKLLLLILPILFACTKNKTEDKFVIKESETNKDLSFINSIRYGGDMDTSYHPNELIKKYKINSSVEYNFKNVGIFYETIERYPYLTYHYNKEGEETRAEFNETMEVIDLNKKREKKYTIDTTWEGNKIKVRIEYKKTIVHKNWEDITDTYIVKNDTGIFKEGIVEDTAMNVYKTIYEKNKVITIAEEFTGRKWKSVWEWKKDNKGRITSVTINHIETSLNEREIILLEWDGDKLKRALIKKGNGDVIERVYKRDNKNRIIEVSTFEDGGKTWFTVDYVYYNSLDLISKREHYIVDKSEYKNYLLNRNVKKTMVEGLCKEWEYFTRDKPFDPIK